MAKTLAEIQEEMKAISNKADTVDVSAEKAKLSAKQIKQQMLIAEHKARSKAGEPVGTLDDFIATRQHGHR